MGAADLVPGVSGGTIAFIVGIYGRLITSLNSIDLESLRVLLQGNFAAFWTRIDGNFLALVIAGILSSVFTLAHLIDHLLEDYPILVWSAFFGLIAVSAASLSLRNQIFRSGHIAPFVGGLVFVLGLSLLTRQPLAPGIVVIFCAGFIAISAMLLPGISGSFLLLLFGLYEPLLEAIRVADMGFLFTFGAGACLGLVSFSHLIHWLLSRHHLSTLSFLVGLLCGSLYAVWPWRAGQGANHPVWPSDVPGLSDPMVLPAVACMVLAALAVPALEAMARRAAGDD